MSISRRRFLLNTAGASIGAIVPDYYFRALQFLEQFGEPLLEPPPRPTEILYSFNHCDELELSLGDPYEGPPEMTFRDYFTRFEPEGFETFDEYWDPGKEGLDELIDEQYWWDYWSMNESSSAKASFYLESLDLGADFEGTDAVGSIEFFVDSNMVSMWRGVRYKDEITLSLLQQRLNDLGTGIRIETAYYPV